MAGHILAYRSKLDSYLNTLPSQEALRELILGSDPLIGLYISELLYNILGGVLPAGIAPRLKYLRTHLELLSKLSIPGTSNAYKTKLLIPASAHKVVVTTLLPYRKR